MVNKVITDQVELDIFFISIVTLRHDLGLVPPNINFEILQYSKSVFSPLLNGENGLKIA